MRQSEVIAILSQHQADIRSFGVGALYLFGSHARGEATSISDIDVFIDRAPEKPFGFLELTNLEFYLESKLGTEVDVLTRSSLHPDLKEKIEASAIKVF